MFKEMRGNDLVTIGSNGKETLFTITEGDFAMPVLADNKETGETEQLGLLILTKISAEYEEEDNAWLITDDGDRAVEWLYQQVCERTEEDPVSMMQRMLDRIKALEEDQQRT